MAKKESQVGKKLRTEKNEVVKNYSKNFSIRNEHEIKLNRSRVEKTTDVDMPQPPAPEQKPEQPGNKSEGQQKEKKRELEVVKKRYSFREQRLPEKREADRRETHSSERSEKFEESRKIEPYSFREQRLPESRDSDSRETHASERPDNSGERDRYPLVRLGESDGGLQNVLESIPIGRESLEIVRLYDVKIRVNPEDSASFYNIVQYEEFEANTIYLAREHKIEQVALTLIHEANHVKYHHTGESANILTLDRNAYIKGMLKEETEGTVKSILAKKEMQQAGINVEEISYPLEHQYWDAYYTQVLKTLASYPGAFTTNEIEQISDYTSKSRVNQGFSNPADRIVASVRKVSYEEYYGSSWDRVHNS